MHTAWIVPPRALHCAVGPGSATGGGSEGGGAEVAGADDPLGGASGGGASRGGASSAGGELRTGWSLTVGRDFGWEAQLMKTSIAAKPSPRISAS